MLGQNPNPLVRSLNGASPGVEVGSGAPRVEPKGASGFFIGGFDLDAAGVQEKVGLVEDMEAGPSIEDLVMDLHVETQLNFEEGEEEYETTFVGKEFLSAMVVVRGSKLAGKTMAQSGINKLPGVHLFSIERPLNKKSLRRVIEENADGDEGESDHDNGSVDGITMGAR